MPRSPATTTPVSPAPPTAGGRRHSGSATWARQLPDIQFGSAVNGISTTRIGYGANSSYEGRVLILSDSVSWVKSHHLFKFGGEFRRSDLTSHTATGVLASNFAPDQTRFLDPPGRRRRVSGSRASCSAPSTTPTRSRLAI